MQRTPKPNHRFNSGTDSTPLLRTNLLILCGCLIWLATVSVYAQSNNDGSDSGATTGYELDRIVAIVNDDVIVLSDLKQRVQQVLLELGELNTPSPTDDVLQQQVLQQMVVELLQLQVARNTGVNINDQALHQSLEVVAKRNNLTLDDFRQKLQQEGINFARYRERIRKEMMITQARQQQIQRRVRITDNDIDLYLVNLTQSGPTLGSVRLQHILIAVPEAASSERIAAARATVQEVLRQINEGADFGQMAVAHSEGQQALQGGDLGWRQIVDLPTLFTGIVSDMDIGDVKGPFRSPSGFHLIRIADLQADNTNIVSKTHARHILIAFDQLTDNDAAKIQIDTIYNRLANGEDFAELARKHSSDSGSSPDGGDLGWLSPGDTVSTFQDQLDQLQPQEISQPFRTRFGWHIVEVLERRQFDDTEQAQRTLATQKIWERRFDEELLNWLRELRDNAFINLRLVQS